MEVCQSLRHNIVMQIQLKRVELEIERGVSAVGWSQVGGVVVHKNLERDRLIVIPTTNQ
jgi:hypothetical protein